MPTDRRDDDGEKWASPAAAKNASLIFGRNHTKARESESENGYSEGPVCVLEERLATGSQAGDCEPAKHTHTHTDWHPKEEEQKIPQEKGKRMEGRRKCKSRPRKQDREKEPFPEIQGKESYVGDRKEMRRGFSLETKHFTCSVLRVAQASERKGRNLSR